MNDFELGWLIGFFDGEGWYAIRNRGRGFNLGIGNTDLDLLERVLQYTGEGHISGPYLRPSRKPTWVWQVTDWAGASRLLLAIYPSLSARRKAKALKEIMPVLEYGPPLRPHQRLLINGQLTLWDS